ncbi:MAG: hypothetical protein ACK4F9_03465 [Brevinematia bacterium]
MNSKIVLTTICILMIFSFRGFSQNKENPFSEDVYKVSHVLHKILTNYLNMEFDKIIPLSEGKAKKDMEKMIFYIQTPSKYSQIKNEISLLSNPKIKDIRIFEEENLGIALVEWEYKRSVPNGTNFGVVSVKREVNYMFKKFGKEWKLISYR